MLKTVKINNGKAIKLIIAILSGGLLAWLLKDIWAPLLSDGRSFSERSLPVQILLMVIFTGVFSLIVRGFLKANDSISEQSGLKPATLLAVIGGLTGALIFYLVYGIGTLDTGRVDWLFNLGDNAQHYLGWVFYRNDPWTFPIGFSCSLGYPTGTCMCFTDSIPLLAIPLKLFAFLLPETFQYFGWWTLLNFSLQGMFAALILYEVTRSRLAALIAPLFFCTADILLFRVFRYTPLSGQWIVLFALYLYFLNRRTEDQQRLWPLVHIMAVLIQGYFFVMTFVVFCGTLLERYIKDRKILPILKALFLSLVSTALCLWVVGFFTASVDMSDAGLGYFKANLNAFINPLQGWSQFFQPLPLTEGTYSNVNYLGFGIILLFLAGLITFVFRNKEPLRGIFACHAGLIVIIPVLVVFALSNVITWNDRVLFTYSLPEPILRLWGVFRGTERMLWPVYYLVFIFAICQVTGLSSRRWVTGVMLLAAFGIQVAEVFPQLERFHSEFNQPQGKETSLRSEFWTDAAGQYDSMVILPLSLQNWDRLTEFAAISRMKINYSYYARQSPLLEPLAKMQMSRLVNGETRSGELYIIKSPELLQDVCSHYGDTEFLAYVNKEWVLAPKFNHRPGDYSDVSITGSNSNCSRLSLPDFLSKYNDKLLILTAMDDVSTIGNVTVTASLQSAGLKYGLPDQAGMSYVAVILQNEVIFEDQSEEKIEISTKSGGGLDRTALPVNLQITSAGRISGEEDAVIAVNGVDYSYHQKGLNIAVIDPATGKVVDTALFSPVEE